MAKKVSLIICLVTIGSVLGLLLTGWLSALHLVNTVFFCSLCLLIAGIMLLLLEKGFFDRLVVGFKRFFRSFDKSKQFLDELEGKKQHLPRSRTFAFTIPVLLSGVILFLLTIFTAFLL